MNVALRKPMTQNEFLSWAGVQEGCYEFDDGQPVAMTSGSNIHGLVVANITFQLRGRLRGQACRMFPAESGGIVTIGTNIRYPDATVTCSPLDRESRFIPNPVIVFEVVSDSNARTDRFIKMYEYHKVPSIKRYVLVEQNSPDLVSYTRENDEPWTVTSLSLGDTLSLPEIGIEIPVNDVFDEVDFVRSQPL